VNSGSAAEDAGLQAGDVLLELDGNAIKDIADYQAKLSSYRPDSKIVVTYIRNNLAKKATVQLKSQQTATGAMDKNMLELLTQLGLQTRDLTDVEGSNWQTQGVMVVSIRAGSKIALTNMEPNFIITKINGKTVRNQLAFVNALDITTGKILLEGFYPRYKGSYAYSFIK
jgi:serine protease Do